MADQKLKTAILGLNQKGQELLEAAQASDCYEIVAVAGRDAEILDKVSRRYGCEAFEDYRQVVIQNKLDILLAAGAMPLCDEQLRIAMKSSCDVLRVIPPALDFKQSAELVSLAKREKVRINAANIWRYAPSFRDLHDHLVSEGTDSFHLITAVCNIPQDLSDPKERWLLDPALAGGGVLMYQCFGILDQIVSHFGIPQQVYAVTSNNAPDRQQRLSLTEDSVILTMRFSDTLLCNLVASRTFGPWDCYVRLHHQQGYLTATRESFEIAANDGQVQDLRTYAFDEDQLLRRLLENVAAHRRNPEDATLLLNMEDDLAVMAVIESAYLSSRTATPEEPAKVLSIVRADPTSIWTTGQKLV